MSTFLLFCLLVLVGRVLIDAALPAPVEDDEPEDAPGVLDDPMIRSALVIYAYTELTDDDEEMR